jgi:hypothetical protein
MSKRWKQEATDSGCFHDVGITEEINGELLCN